MLGLKSIKGTLLSSVVVAAVFLLSIQSQVYWQSKLVFIEQVLLGLFVVTIVFSAYFSRSRIAFLTAVSALFYFTSNYPLNWSAWVNAQPQWLLLTGAFIYALMSQIKDRGVVSVHGINRVVFIALCGVLAYGWLQLSDLIIAYVPINAAGFSWQNYLTVEAPLFVVGGLLLWRSVSSSSLLMNAVFISFVIWCLYSYHLLPLPQSIILTILISYYFLVVIIDAYFLAYRDELTTLPSRRALNQLALSLGRKYTVAMLDIDHFKKFNDTYGHDIGDQVLKLVASKLAEVKSGGRVFRYGGEEFTIVFSRKQAEHVLAELDRIRQLVADYAIVIRHPQRQTKQARNSKQQSEMKTVSVTISIGVASRLGKQSFEQTLKTADQALYRAKKKGRNNVSV